MNNSNFQIIKAVMRNLRSKTLNKDFIGYTIQKKIKDTDVSDILKYAAATKDSNPNYQENNPILPATYISKLIWPEIKKIITNKKLKMNILRMVHAEQTISWFNPIRANDSLDFNLSVTNICPTPAGELLEITCKIYSNSELALESISNLIVRKKKSTKTLNKIDAPFEREDYFELPIETSENQQLDYAEASGDYNFIHTSNFLAKLAGLPRTILHGSCVMSMCCNTLADNILDFDLSRIKEFKLRFAYPVLPGEKLKLVAFKSQNNNELFFEVFNNDEKAVIKNGFFRYN